jgi:hypothetical protein
MFVMALGMKYLARFLLVLCSAGGTLSADNEVRRIQEAPPTLNDQAEAVCGRSLNVFKVQKSGEGLHFVSMKEQAVRD